MSDTIPPEIQAWIAKDTLYLNECNLEQFNKYKQWFFGPDHDDEPNWLVAITQVINDLEGTKT